MDVRHLGALSSGMRPAAHVSAASLLILTSPLVADLPILACEIKGSSTCTWEVWLDGENKLAVSNSATVVFPRMVSRYRGPTETTCAGRWAKVLMPVVAPEMAGNARPRSTSAQ